MTPEAEFLIAVLRGAGMAPPQSINLQALLELADSHGVLPLLYRNFPGQLPEIFANRVRSQWTASAFLSTELERLLEQFTQIGLEVLPLKGPLLAETLYGSPGLRTSDDLDFLVLPQDFGRAQSLLLELGFVPADETDDYHQSFQRQNTLVELHFAVAPPSSPSMDLKRAWGRARMVNLRGQTARSFAPPDLLLYLTLHGVKHEFARLIWILDVARALGQLESGDSKTTMELAQAVGMEGALLTTCALARRAFGAALPASIADPIACKPVISTRAGAILEKVMAASANPTTTHQGASLFVQLELKARSRWTQRLRLFLPSQQDRLWAHQHHIDPRCMLFLRPLRLLAKHGLGVVWRTLFPRFGSRQPVS